MDNQKGFAFIETIVALAILGAAGIAFLSGLATVSKGTLVSQERTIAESLVRSQIEYVEIRDYETSVSQYPVSPTLTIPNGWQVPPSVVQPVHGTDDGLQRVTVEARHNGKTVLSVVVYKVNK